MVNLTIDPAKIEGQIILFLQKTREKTGFKYLVIGVSGGVDSAVSLFLAVKAYGADFIHPVLLPFADLYSESFKNAESVVQKTGIKEENVIKIDINNTVESIANSEGGMDKLRKGNIMVRIRMVYLYDLSKKYRALVLGTENRTEYLLGYFTRFGDEASDIEPLQHLYKTEVGQLVEYLDIPRTIIEQKPTAGLWEGQTDEGELGFSYSEADCILYLYVDLKKTKKEILKSGFKQKTVERVLARLSENSFKHRLPYIFREKRL